MPRIAAREGHEGHGPLGQLFHGDTREGLSVAVAGGDGDPQAVVDLTTGDELEVKGAVLVVAAKGVALIVLPGALFIHNARIVAVRKAPKRRIARRDIGRAANVYEPALRIHRGDVQLNAQMKRYRRIVLQAVARLGGSAGCHSVGVAHLRIGRRCRGAIERRGIALCSDLRASALPPAG